MMQMLGAGCFRRSRTGVYFEGASAAPNRNCAYLMDLMVPRVGLEPTREKSHQVLNLTCLPFHHRGTYCAKTIPHSGGFFKGYSSLDALTPRSYFASFRRCHSGDDVK